MAIQPINNGQAPNDGTGQTLRDAFSRVNENYLEIQALLNGKSDVGHTHPISDIIGLQSLLTAIQGDITSINETISSYPAFEAQLEDLLAQLNTINESITALNEQVAQQNDNIISINAVLDEILDLIAEIIADAQSLQNVLNIGSVATIDKPFEVHTSNNTNARGSFVLNSEGAKVLGESGSLELSGAGVTVSTQGQAFNLSSQETNISAGAWGSIRMNSTDGMSLNSAAGKLKLNGAGGGIEIDGGGPGTKALNKIDYSTDVSSTYTERSLVDREYVDTQLSNVDSDVVHKTGDETIDGVKLFLRQIEQTSGATKTIYNSGNITYVDNSDPLNVKNANLFFDQGTYSKGPKGNINNTAFGAQALMVSEPTGSFNTAFGIRALNALTTGQVNTAVGQNALRFLTTGAQNTAVGYQALTNTTTATHNTSVGYDSLRFNTIGTLNTALGHSAGRNSTEGVRNTFIGSDAARFNILGGANVAIGMGAAQIATQIDGATIVGQAAGTQLTTSSFNTFLGRNSGANITTGSSNVVVAAGNFVAEGSGITSGNNNVILGTVRGLGNVSNNIAIGDGEGNIMLRKTADGLISLNGKTNINGTVTASEATVSEELVTLGQVNTLLSDKADDSEVVHKSGDETIDGIKSFSEIIYANDGIQVIGDSINYGNGIFTGYLRADVAPTEPNQVARLQELNEKVNRINFQGQEVDANSLTLDGIYTAFNWLNTPESSIATLTAIVYSGDWIQQTFSVITDQLKTWTRTRYNGDTWSPWRITWNQGNFNPDTKADYNGVNTVGGVWNIDSVNAPGLSISNKQVFSAGGSEIYWGNITVAQQTFEVATANSLRTFVPGAGFANIWNGHNFNPDSKANLNGGNTFNGDQIFNNDITTSGIIDLGTSNNFGVKRNLNITGDYGRFLMTGLNSDNSTRFGVGVVGTDDTVKAVFIGSDTVGGVKVTNTGLSINKSGNQLPTVALDVNGSANIVGSILVQGTSDSALLSGGELSLNFSSGDAMVLDATQLRKYYADSSSYGLVYPTTPTGTGAQLPISGGNLQSVLPDSPQQVVNNWYGSQAEYDALGTYDNNVMYYVV